jgi:nucleotide-binding universal stress UspA family protein
VVSFLQGHPARELIDRSRGARLLVVGGRRESGVEHIMLGSVATQCVEHATVPVLVVHDEPISSASIAESGPSAGRVVVGVDGSASSIEALRWAATIAAIDGNGIDALTVWKPPLYTSGFGYPALPQTWDVPELSSDGELAKKMLHDDVGEAFGSAPPPDLREVLEEGFPAHHLLEHSRGAALLVVGSRGRGGFASLLLGSVSLKCVNNARCPVLVVHVPAAIVDAPDRSM